jgi:antibiotic biosynthesis monooxygenase (ABM) superfamily enzyme
METQHVINIAGTTCPPKSEGEFNKWYDEKHIPLNMKFNGLMEATRYQLVRFTDTAVFKNYPRYMTPYKFKDLATFKAWNTSPELAKATEGASELWAKWGVDFIWRVQYEHIKSWGSTSPNSVVTLVATSARLEEPYDRWYSDKHIPDLLKFKGLQGAARYQLASTVGLAVKGVGKVPTPQPQEYPKYFTFYYFKDTAAADAYDTSPERNATLDEWFGVVKDYGITVLWRAQYKPMRSWQR